MGGYIKMQNYFIAIQNLSNMLRSEFNVPDAQGLATALCDRGVYELTSDMTEMLLYIQDNVINLDKSEYTVASILKNENKKSLVQKKELYEYYVPNTKGKKKNNLRCFEINKEKINRYEKIFKDNGFSENEIYSIMSVLVDMVAKSPEDILKVLDELKIFGITSEQYKQFVLQNAFYLFRDFFRNVNVCFSELIQKYGVKEKAFQELCNHPEIMMEY